MRNGMTCRSGRTKTLAMAVDREMVDESTVRSSAYKHPRLLPNRRDNLFYKYSQSLSSIFVHGALTCLGQFPRNHQVALIAFPTIKEPECRADRSCYAQLPILKGVAQGPPAVSTLAKKLCLQKYGPRCTWFLLNHFPICMPTARASDRRKNSFF